MLNKEKYRDKIFEIAINHDTCGVKNGEVHSCEGLNCYECDFYSSDHCDMDFQIWANSKYKEPEIDWSKVPVDTPVLVKDYCDEEWKKRYFARCNYSSILTFIDGKTSWSDDGNNQTKRWDYAKFAREEDIEKYRKR